MGGLGTWWEAKVKRTCLTCGKDFKTNNRAGKYCSKHRKKKRV
jgi:hypothetical protein